jgi:aminopeptidase
MPTRPAPAGDADLLRRGDHAGALSFRADDSFDRAAGWLYEGVAKAFANNTARLAVVGDNPMLLAAEDPAKVGRASKANSIAYQPALEKIAGFDINWNILAYPGAAWARQVFPAMPRRSRSPSSPMRSSPPRASTATIRRAWAAHNAALRSRTEWLNGQRFQALHFTGPGTDLTSGWPTAMNGRAAPRPPRTASPATPTSRPKRSSPRRMHGASTVMSPAPSRSPIRAR